MSISFEKKSGAKQRGGGFYVAVALCCAAVCLVAWSTVLGNDNEDSTADDVSTQLPTQEYTQIDEEYPVITDELVSAQETPDDTIEWVAQEEQTPEAEQISLPTQPVEQQSFESEQEAIQVAAPPVTSPVFMMPVAGGQLLKAYSAGALVYCETMGDWRVHEGVDVACAEGEEVYCASAGTVYSLYEDVLYGNTAVVEHADGSLLYYSGLSDFSRLSQGMQLSAGDLMGSIGVIPCEAADGPHLHLAYMSEGSYVEPLSAMGLS